MDTDPEIPGPPKDSGDTARNIAYGVLAVVGLVISAIVGLAMLANDIKCVRNLGS